MKNKRNIPPYTIDKSLDRFSGKNLFPEHLKRVNDALAECGLPKAYYLSQGLTPPDSQK